MTTSQPPQDSPTARVRQRKTGVIRPVGPYSKRAVLGRLDRRTREGKALAAFRAEMVDYVGGSPTLPQRILIDQAAILRLQIGFLNDRFAETGELGGFSGIRYLSWVNTLAGILAKLGIRSDLDTPPSGPPALDDYLAAAWAAPEGADDAEGA